MTSISRRSVLKLGGGVAASAAMGVTELTHAATSAPVGEGRVNLPYQMKVIVNAQQLQVNAPVLFFYPDAASPCTLIKMGTPVPGGVGPERDIVAFSTLCTHMGCSVAYDVGQKLFKCPCHFSLFDPESTGQMVSGHATENLPSILLEYNPQDDSVRAVAVEGLIYGRQSNLL